MAEGERRIGRRRGGVGVLTAFLAAGLVMGGAVLGAGAMSGSGERAASPAEVAAAEPAAAPQATAEPTEDPQATSTPSPAPAPSPTPTLTPTPASTPEATEAPRAPVVEASDGELRGLLRGDAPADADLEGDLYLEADDGVVALQLAEDLRIVAGPALAASAPVPVTVEDLTAFLDTPEGAATPFRVTVVDGRVEEIAEDTDPAD